MTESNGTSICGIVGSPVTHSLSPVIHNAAFKHMGLDYLYLSFDTPHGNLQSRLAEIREYSYRGVNVTIPNKVAVLPFLDKLEPLARRIGAVNTIVNQKGSLKGYNTDAGGFMLPLLSIGFKPQGKHVLLLGAGGAARAIAYALAVKGALVTIMNRPAHFDKAQELAANIGVVTGHPVKALPLNRLLIAEEMSQTALLVNTTSVGMFPHDNKTLVDANLLRPETMVYDIIYRPRQTRLLKEAAQKGCPTISGLEMLLRQGALSFKLWTGVEVPLHIMRQAALAQLEGRKTSLALIGFMGAGKSTVGRALAQALKMPLIDIDEDIEKAAAKSISRIFAENGEAVFRGYEKKAVHRASNNNSAVIACGGGVVLDEENITNLKNKAVVIYLKCSPGLIQSRLDGSAQGRPLLDGADRAENIKRLMRQRENLYSEAADMVIDADCGDVITITKTIIDNLKEYESFNFEK